MSLLQTLLADIERKATEKSLAVSRDIAIIEAAHAWADRLADAGHRPLVTMHFTQTPTLVHLHTQNHLEPELRAALAALGVAPPLAADSEVAVAPNVAVVFVTAADALQQAA